ncbi:BnaA01g27500D [Brassica napus]|uniref:BnaA01g27500D protein n=1 Tax=Brassica napus TaxID=3708 RepID=A0A078HC10_BRANA|nr:BnaA01g27500D [Brassica napus]
MGSLVVLICLLIMSMCICVALSHAQDDFSLTGFDNPRTTVVIINDIAGYLPLRYHCKSKDDDLGDRTMAPRGSDRLFAEFGCRRCEWKIRKTGPCKLNKDNGMFDVCLPWN